MAKEPEPIGGIAPYRGMLWMIPAGMLTLYALIMVATGEPDRQIRMFTENCATIWADYENKVITTDVGSSEILTCMVKVNGKWTPETNVKVSP